MVTQLELLQRARQYIDALSQGEDPITGRALPEDAVLNNVRLSRCFFFVSDILRQVIENGGQVGRPAAGGAAPFALPAELRAQIPIEPETMIMRFVQSINALVDQTVMRRLKVTAVTQFLLEQGYFSEHISHDKRYKTVTDKGKALGLREEQRTRPPNQIYTAVLYSEAAQRFVVEHLDEIIAVSNGDAA